MLDFLKRHRPSPALVLAFIALLVALSGTAVGLPGRGSVDSGDIKDRVIRNKDLRSNAVTGSKVKGNSLTGSDVQNLGGADINSNSVTGEDIDEGTLGAVPQAANAAQAGTVNGVTPVPVVTAAPGEIKTVATKGPLTVQLVCTDLGSGDLEYSLQIQTSAPNAAAGAGEFSGGLNEDLDPADGPMAVRVGDTTGSPESIDFRQAGWSARTPSGERFDGYGSVTANFGSTPGCTASVVVFG
jgi:hypothetical protein